MTVTTDEKFSIIDKQKVYGKLYFNDKYKVDIMWLIWEIYMAVMHQE